MTRPFQNLADTSTDLSAQRKALRQFLRQRRRDLSLQQQRLAAHRLAATLRQHPRVVRAKAIGLYLPNDGEIDPRVFMEQTRRRSVHFYLPVLHPVHSGQLAFCRYDNRTPLKPNRFGIPEPVFHSRHLRSAWSLDVILMPLVGFDPERERLGMGGGFYDRTLAFTRIRPRLRPMLVGLAHEVQKVDSLPVAPWDIPLDAVVTDVAVY